MKYKYKFSKTIFILLIAVYVVATVCFIMNLIKLINCLTDKFATTPYQYISIGLCLLLPIVAVIFVTAVLFSSYYTFENKKLICKYGFFKDSFALESITSVCKNLTTGRISVVFQDSTFYNVLIEKYKAEDFICQIISLNRNIVYEELKEDKKQ